ncbi:hypothetical protein SAMN04488020_105157 [Palleronia marisminoris]|uniref:Uncharacterized protein n=1 Tax=Palleronia marisminoris TaxID=315423 RepID=A0A1Y5ST32_9RHOB|nr:hypothetical protein [Palleronia marisminoris]SFG96738.1 hypothetical protein SAMN04488020_105157 [Palleronia marisminoris]SLN47449.1 hypothetical protein PAM7066_02101 [Palleronia marisminoris]
MSKSSSIPLPHDWPEVEEQVREAIIAMASILEMFGPDDDHGATVVAFLGQSVDIHGNNEASRAEIASVDITRHGLYRFARLAWCYAYQVDEWQDFSVEVLHETSCGLLTGGYALTDRESEPTGLNPLNDLALRRVIETANARWYLTEENSDLTVRQLGLLTNMADTTVRSSLSKEGFRLEPSHTKDDDKSAYTLPYKDALLWLSRRRGFIPNAAAPSPDRYRAAIHETLADRSVPFPTVLRRMAEMPGAPNAGEINVAPKWYEGLVGGRAVAPDVEALVTVADAYDAPRAVFAARGVEHLLELAGDGNG